MYLQPHLIHLHRGWDERCGEVVVVVRVVLKVRVRVRGGGGGWEIGDVRTDKSLFLWLLRHQAQEIERRLPRYSDC